MELKDLVGPHMLQGVDIGEGADGGATLLFVLDDVVYACLEDPGDGWRSYMRDLGVIPGGTVSNRFPGVAVVGRYVEQAGTGYYIEACDILELVDVVTERVVLRVGTESLCDYYPCYVGEFHPDAMVCNQRL